MTASQPALPPDPLSPATAPVASAPAPAAAAEKLPEQPPKKRSAVLLLGLIGCGALLLLGGGAAALMFFPKSEPTAVSSAPPVPPNPGAPPAMPQFVVEQARPAARNLDPPVEHLALIGDAAKRLQSRLFVGSGETAAPREFIVRGGGANDVAGLAIPNHERWELQFPPGLTIEAYTRQLDFFKIELGVIGGSQTVSYLAGLSNPKPRVRTAPGNTDARLYLIWNRGPLREADEILVARAGLNAEGKVLAHFCPAELEAEMLRVEAEHARTNNLTNVRRTVFGIQPVAADTFRLVVTDQKGD